MFELGRKDSDTGHAASAHSVTGQAASATPRAASGSGAIIGRSIKINGDVKGAEDLRIEGDVSGTVELKSNSLTVGKEGKVSADIYARSITVEGTTEGDLFASERIAIRASANVRGNLLAPRVSLEEGARFKGAIEMDPQAVEKALGPVQSQAKTGSASDSLASKPNGNVKPANEPASVASAGR